MRTVSAAEQTPVQRFVVAPSAFLAVMLTWCVVLYVWLLWWVVLAVALPLMLLA
jgi:hypothetical protein